MTLTDLAVVSAAMVFAYLSFKTIMDVVVSFWEEEAEDVEWEEK